MGGILPDVLAHSAYPPLREMCVNDAWQCGTLDEPEGAHPSPIPTPWESFFFPSPAPSLLPFLFLCPVHLPPFFAPSFLFPSHHFSLPADFGFARYLTGTDMAATLCGSPLYMVSYSHNVTTHAVECFLLWL